MIDDESKKDIYRVLSVKKTKPIEGAMGETWHHYTIARGNSIIEGKQPGSISEVREHAESFADGLNERAALGSYAYYTKKRK